MTPKEFYEKVVKMREAQKNLQKKGTNMKARPNITLLSKEIFEVNKAKGYHNEDRSNEHFLMLVVTELSEAVEYECTNSNPYGLKEYRDGCIQHCDECDYYQPIKK